MKAGTRVRTAAILAAWPSDEMDRYPWPVRERTPEIDDQRMAIASQGEEGTVLMERIERGYWVGLGIVRLDDGRIVPFGHDSQLEEVEA